jgi:hypothetical protein
MPMMNRRELVKYLALMAAGASALPAQVGAFERYYDANTPITDEPLAVVDDIWLCGNAARSTRVLATFFPGTLVELPLAINAFGGILRWSGGPGKEYILRRREVTWELKSSAGDETDVPFADVLAGHISYIDAAAVRRTLKIHDWQGGLA